MRLILTEISNDWSNNLSAQFEDQLMRMRNLLLKTKTWKTNFHRQLDRSDDKNKSMFYSEIIEYSESISNKSNSMTFSIVRYFPLLFTNDHEKQLNNHSNIFLIQSYTTMQNKNVILILRKYQTTVLFFSIEKMFN